MSKNSIEQTVTTLVDELAKLSKKHTNVDRFIAEQFRSHNLKHPDAGLIEDLRDSNDDKSAKLRELRDRVSELEANLESLKEEINNKQG